MMYTMTHLSALGGLPPEHAIAAATGNNARVYGLNSGFIGVGKDADIAILDAPLGGSKATALEAIANGDPAAVGAVVTAGIPRFVGRSRNTPATTRKIAVTRSALTQDFA
jgi:enamidase